MSHLITVDTREIPIGPFPHQSTPLHTTLKRSQKFKFLTIIYLNIIKLERLKLSSWHATMTTANIIDIAFNSQEKYQRETE